MLSRLQRNMKHRWVGGVCSGLARFIGLDVFPIRILLRILCLASLPVTWWIYGLLWIFMPAQKLYEYDDIFPQQPLKNLRVPTSYQAQKNRLKELYANDREGYKRAKDELKAALKHKDKEVKRLEFATVLPAMEGRVSDRVYAKARRIDEATRLLMPQLTWWNVTMNQDLATVKRAALEYFPQTMQHYLNLPRSYTETHHLSTGQTPEETLLADLDVLERSINGIIERNYDTSKVPVPGNLKTLSQRFSLYSEPHQDIEGALEVLLERIHGNVKIDETIYQKVQSVRNSVLAVLPHLDATMTQQAYDVKQTALEYLPDAIEKYLNLPAGFSSQQYLSNGKTARDTLLEQLDLLDVTLKNIVADLYKKDADGLLIHGRFLKEKFANQKFALPEHS